MPLALKLFDAIIEQTGLEYEIDQTMAFHILFPLLEQMDQAAGVAPDRARHLQMAERVLAALSNEKDGQRPFKISYTDFEQGQATQHTLSVRLIEER